MSCDTFSGKCEVCPAINSAVCPFGVRIRSGEEDILKTPEELLEDGLLAKVNEQREARIRAGGLGGPVVERFYKKLGRHSQLVKSSK